MMEQGTTKPKTMPMTKEKATAYITGHQDLRPRRLLAEATGWSMSKVYRMLRSIGRRGGEGFSVHDPVHDGRIRELYPTHSDREVAEILGISRSVVYRFAKKHQLSKAYGYKQRMHEKMLANYERGRTPEARAKGGANLSKAYRMERFRKFSGMPQKTRLHVGKTPRRVLTMKSRLICKCNCFSKRGSLTLYYDSETRRHPNEQHYTEKYHLKFEPA